MAVGAGDRRGEDVADGQVGGHLRVAHQHVARLAVLAHDRDALRARSASVARGRNAS